MVEKGIAPFGRDAEEGIGGEIIWRGHAVFGTSSASALFQQAKGQRVRRTIDLLLARSAGGLYPEEPATLVGGD